MTLAQVICSRAFNVPADDIWAVLRGFDLNWHPFVSTCRLSHDKTGALLRDFTTTDGGHLIEQLTYFSDTDRVLRYTALSGIAGAQSYHATVQVRPTDAGCNITWQADITAAKDRADDIARGTKPVFEAAFAALATGVPAPAPPKPAPVRLAKVNSATTKGDPRLSFLCAGPPAKALVLFLHGIGGQASNWSDQMETFGATHKVAALNLRGYGDSALGAHQTTIDDHCADILRLMDNQGAQNLILVGLSMGSWIATSFAMRHPERLAGLVLAGGCTGMSEAREEEREAFRTSRETPLAQGQTPKDFAPAVVDLLAGPKARQKTRKALFNSMAAIPARTYKDALSCFTNPTERFDFAKITCPVLMMTGSHDKLAPPEEIRIVAERIHQAGIETRGTANIRFEVIKDAGHLCNLEDPNTFNRHMAEFLQALPCTTPALAPQT